jgi:hypothetical protein
MIIGKLTRLEDIEKMEINRPEHAGSRWKGVKHSTLINTIRNRLNERRCTIIEERHSVSDDEMSLVGCFDIEVPGLQAIEGQRYSLGYRHSNDMRYPITLSVGGHIMVCHNGVITGEHILKRKHTTGLNLEAELFHGINRAMTDFSDVRASIENLRQKYITNIEVSDALVVGANRNLYPWSWIGKIHDEYYNPSEDNPECVLNSAWGYYNAASYVLKGAKPERQIRSLYGVLDILN